MQDIQATNTLQLRLIYRITKTVLMVRIYLLKKLEPLPTLLLLIIDILVPSAILVKLIQKHIFLDMAIRPFLAVRHSIFVSTV